MSGDDTIPLPLRYKRVIVVGAGQAGLAMADALIRQGLRPQEDFVVIDAAVPYARSWSRRWHSLRLFTSARHSALPDLRFPRPRVHYPSADDVADYLQRYADELGIRPVWLTTVTGLEVDEHGHGLRLVTNHGVLTTRTVVAATGPYSIPVPPSFAADARVPGIALHSDDYRHPGQIPAGRVLIVGGGNTGMQIARELSATHSVTIAIGRPSRELPQRFWGVDIFTWLKAFGVLSIPVDSRWGRWLARQEIVIGESRAALVSRGVTVVGRVQAVDGHRFTLEDGRSVEVDSAVWATGYRPGIDWLPASVRNDDGHLIHTKGVTAIPGLYALGMPWMRNRASTLLTGVGRDARPLARRIARRPCSP